jgi:hypothetical protein
MRKGNPLTNSPKTDPIREEFPQSTTPLRNPLFTPIMPVVCAGFAVRADFGGISLVPMEGFGGGQVTEGRHTKIFLIGTLYRNDHIAIKNGMNLYKV